MNSKAENTQNVNIELATEVDIGKTFVNWAAPGRRAPGAAPIFSSHRDHEIEMAGGFFCLACLVAHPATKQSPDPRYCRDCFDLLTVEATLLPEKKRPKWLPKTPKFNKPKNNTTTNPTGIKPNAT